MDLEKLERSLKSSASAAILVDGRVLRRIIKLHRKLRGLGLAVPHARCYAIDKSSLTAILDPAEIGYTAETLPADALLVARPTPADTFGKTEPQVLRDLWRAAFHADIHRALDRRFATGALDQAGLRERIDRIGQTEFDEIRAILRNDDLLLPPHDDRETYTEFAALYLELHHFAPTLIERTFPTLRDHARIERTLAADLDALVLIERSCPEGADPIATVARVPGVAETTSPTYSTQVTLFGRLPQVVIGTPSPERSARLGAEADEARRKGNAVRAALLRISAAPGVDEASRLKLVSQARGDLESLAVRLGAALKALHGQKSELSAAAWISSLVILAQEADRRRGLRYPVEARLLYDLQRAAVAHERPIKAVDLATYLLSFGKRPIVRPLPATREVRIARHIHAALHKLRHVRLPNAERKLLAKLLYWARDRANDNVRAALRPRIREVLEAVNLRPESLPEEVSRDKVVDELCDQAVSTGFFNLGHLRDALSRNQIKLPNLENAGKLFKGDELLEADRRLDHLLDGVYRPGEIYLRLLQKISSLGFGTTLGRLFTLYLALPFGGAFVLLEGLGHIVGPLSEKLGFGEILLLTPTSFVVTSIVLFGLIHSEAIRVFARRGLSFLAKAITLLLFRLPRAILELPVVRRILAAPLFKTLVRRLFLPLIVTGVLIVTTPLREQDLGPLIGGAIALFVLSNVLVNTSVFSYVEEVALEWMVGALRMLGKRFLPGLWRFIVDGFRAMLDLFERALYQVSEALRFREGEGRITLVGKAGLGIVWFVIAYVARLYINLFIEPEINPLKHFPVVTVAHKLCISISEDLLHFLQGILSPLGSFIANTVAGFTVFFFPSIFGFLVWELKENWKLYRKNRASTLSPVLIGHHGETMGALMIPGFHSGTLPRLYTRLRRTSLREDTEVAAEQKVNKALARHREALSEVEHAISRFFEREMSALLEASPRWPHGRIEVQKVELASNRVKVILACPRLGGTSAIAFEQQSGFVVASAAEAGFINALSGDARTLFENALAGIYKLAGVDLVREQIASALYGDPPYDIADEGLLVWPGQGYHTELVYPLGRDLRPGPVAPEVRGVTPEGPVASLDMRALDFRRTPIAWSAWVDAWRASRPEGEGVPRLLSGPSILPESGILRPCPESPAKLSSPSSSSPLPLAAP